MGRADGGSHVAVDSDSRTARAASSNLRSRWESWRSGVLVCWLFCVWRKHSNGLCLRSWENHRRRET